VKQLQALQLQNVNFIVAKVEKIFLPASFQKDFFIGVAC
jgi:hypothetical protein